RHYQRMTVVFKLFYGAVISGNMNALFDHFHNFFLPLLRGHEHVCQCFCGSEQAYHVVPYHGAMSIDCSYGDYIMTQQEMDLIAGIMLGICISWVLMWLDSVWHRALNCWRTNQLTSNRFHSWMPKFRNIRNVFRCPHPEPSEESSRNMVQIEPQVDGST
uniref:Transmembrane protein 240 n=1 Tax=Oreochromis niloticus TaxID=8128 RepID=A0A669C5C3_ORENI